MSTATAVLSWTPALRSSFDDAKSALVASVQLAHPDSDDDSALSLTTDASDIAVGAVLSQGRDSNSPPLGFFSKKLSEAEKKYSAFDKELLALYLAIRHFRHHLEGRSFTVWTDHKPLCGALRSSTDRSPRQTRHLSFVAEFTTDIQHVPGAANVVADCLRYLHLHAPPRPAVLLPTTTWSCLPVLPSSPDRRLSPVSCPRTSTWLHWQRTNGTLKWSSGDFVVRIRAL